MLRTVMAGLVGAVVGTLITSRMLEPAQAQAPGTLDWVPYLSLVHTDDGTGNLVPTVRVAGANLQVVNGTGTTRTTNSAGNLIVGYNEFGNPSTDDRTGSHNISFGEANSFSSFGGIVGPNESTISGAFATVTGGRGHSAPGDWASVGGGQLNTASGDHSSVGGGRINTASGDWSSVGGGSFNEAGGSDCSVIGGQLNHAGGSHCTVTGGRFNLTTSSSLYNSITGGQRNATGYGGFCSISGGYSNYASGGYSSVSGGYQNQAGGFCSSVSGGRVRSATGPYDWAAGSLFEDD